VDARDKNPPRDTIFALASGTGRAGVAVIRVSGPRADDVLTATSAETLPRERLASVRTLIGKAGDVLDTALVLRFVPPRSYTGENVVEIHAHGGPAVVAALLTELSALAGFRLAEPGEFTRRAVEHGRLDLTQAEAVADLVEAETESQRRQAVRQHRGVLANIYEEWRTRLIRAAAWFEAAIDFPDEEIPADSVQTARAAVDALASEMRTHLDDGRRGEILRDGLQVAVVGPPNAGKSSLVNALARRDVAIVSELPGTTRDVIEVRLNLGGYPVVLLDTAGQREARDEIEEEGIRRARARASTADLRIVVVEGTTAVGDAPAGDILVRNKSDLYPDRTGAGLWVSARTGEGLAQLVDVIAEHARGRMETGEAPVLSRARHRIAVEAAERALREALATPEPELAAEHLRLALREIGRLTGRVDLDELLDVVFRDFCVGK
jgi:tRNA modification GTPase